MSKCKLVICDADDMYCRRLDEYLRNHLKLSFDIFSFTDYGIFQDFAKQNAISLLITSERILMDEIGFEGKKLIQNVLCLDEGLGSSSMVNDGETNTYNIKHVSKYQPASKIVESIIDFCAEESESFENLGTEVIAGKGRVLGFYSPITKCGQTTFAVSVAGRLAKEAKVIFLSFESYSTLPMSIGLEGEEDIIDLLYYSECEKTKFSLYLEKIKKSKNGVDYILPTKTAALIREINLAKVKELYRLLINECGYDYVIVDLTEYPENFFEIENLCYKLFTITRQNPIDNYRVSMYEEVLRQSDFEDILSLTVKCQPPDARDAGNYELFIQDILSKEGILNGTAI